VSATTDNSGVTFAGLWLLEASVCTEEI